ncbi:MAG: EAL domain-containing protein [Ectothiorhodospiraceae bacterium]|nr:EAL domain-containing protein [Chromatiales bacterium]MCP5157409.1 EAL domain-containing protein [Ectothiorhodospiraceae bacterium]
MSKPSTPRVLFVDDDITARVMAEASLGQAGFEVEVAPDGPSALECLTRARPDIVLLDVDMPGVDGFQVCESIRAVEGCATLPILMVTGLDDAASIDRAFAAGATDFAVKPINWSLLRHRLPYLLRSSDTLAMFARTVQALERSQASLSSAERIAGLGSWAWTPGTDEHTWSEQLYRMIGLVREADDAEPGVDCFLRHVPADDHALVAGWFEDVASGRLPGPLVHRLVRTDGAELWVQLRTDASSEESSRERSTHIAVQDVTARTHAEQRIRQLAYFDPVTGLANRASFNERVHEVVREHAALNDPAAVLILDIDNFKRINDTMGHALGDRLLLAIGQRLRQCVGELGPLGDAPGAGKGQQILVSRLGGDEFALLLPRVGNTRQATAVAERCLEVMRSPFNLDGFELFVTPSIGLACFPEHATDPNVLLSKADAAVSHAKRLGKNTCRVFDESMSAEALQRLNLDKHLRHALERGEFELHYQPQLDLRSGRVNAAEALLRWTCPALGRVPPDAFIPLAEENGLIVPIGEWVLRTACRQARAWRDAGLGLRRVAVNISLVQFAQPDFPQLIARILEETGLEPDGLEVEITETMLAKDVEGAIQTLDALRAQNVQLSIDDFGTGYSSLSYLKRFPIHRLKIDRSFVRDITTDPDDAAIATAVLRMAESMKLSVVAEGVETEAQLAFLEQERCDEVQGYFVSRPLPAQELTELMRDPTWPALPNRPSAQGTRRVLFVDDDSGMRSFIAQALADEPFELILAPGTEEAFDILAKGAVEVVVSDLDMPGMNGIEFLERARRLYPDTRRILLTGQGDVRALMGAVNEAAVFRYLAKPVSLRALRQTVRLALSCGDAGPSATEAGGPVNTGLGRATARASG